MKMRQPRFLQAVCRPRMFAACCSQRLAGASGLPGTTRTRRDLHAEQAAAGKTVYAAAMRQLPRQEPERQ